MEKKLRSWIFHNLYIEPWKEAWTDAPCHSVETRFHFRIIFSNRIDSINPSTCPSSPPLKPFFFSPLSNYLASPFHFPTSSQPPITSSVPPHQPLFPIPIPPLPLSIFAFHPSRRFASRFGKGRQRARNRLSTSFSTERTLAWTTGSPKTASCKSSKDPMSKKTCLTISGISMAIKISIETSLSTNCMPHAMETLE